MVLAAIVAEGGCDARNRTSDPLPDGAGSVSVAWVGDMVCGPVAVPLAAPLERGGGREGAGVPYQAASAVGDGGGAGVAAAGNDMAVTYYCCDADAGSWKATHYGESYQGSQLGCPGSGTYDSANPAILAVGPAHYADYPCGTALTVCGAAGCIAGWREDACVGCLGDWIDLSEAGIAAVCGPGVGSCAASVEGR